jgi:hypothetical protein
MNGKIGLLFAVLLGCVPRTEPADTVRSAGGEPASITGTVQIVGSAPVNVQVVLQPDSGGQVRIAGPLLAELQRLSGVEVTVHGYVSRAADPMVERQVEVSTYSVERVNGRPVVMGEVVAIESGRVRLRTADGEEVYLSGAPSDFRVGQKVWVQGPQSIIVQSYGTIRP